MSIRFYMNRLSRSGATLCIFLLIGFPLLAAGQANDAAENALHPAEKLMSQAAESVSKFGHKIDIDFGHHDGANCEIWHER